MKNMKVKIKWKVDVKIAGLLQQDIRISLLILYKEIIIII